MFNLLLCVVTFCSFIPSSPLVCQLALTGVQNSCKFWLQQYFACQDRISCSCRHTFPTLLTEAVLPDHKSHLNVFTWLSSLPQQHAWMQALWIQMCGLQTVGDSRCRTAEWHACFSLFMDLFELIYPSLPHLSCLSSYKQHHLSLTWELSPASPYRGCNKTLEHTWQRAGWKDPCTILMWFECLYILWDKLKLLRALSRSPNGGETARVLKIDKISGLEFIWPTTEK